MFSAGKPLSKKLYIMGLLVIFLTVYGQYFFKLGTALGIFVVYGIPIAVVSVIFGREILMKAAKNERSAFKFGLALFGALTIVGIFLSIIVLTILLFFYPNIVNLLSKPNPVLQVPPTIAWIMIAISLLIVGPAEEYLFRGFVYGGLLSITKGKRWISMAVLSSVIFAVVHAYYAVTYGLASAIPFIDLIAFGLAMSLTYYFSGGNLIAPAIIHGVYDATGFLTVAATTTIGLGARLALIIVGIVIAVVYLPRKIRELRQQPPENRKETEPEPRLASL